MKKLPIIGFTLIFAFTTTSFWVSVQGEENSSSKYKIYRSVKELLAEMENVYGDINTLRAKLNMVDTDPESSDLELKLTALSGEKNVLRVEFIAPPAMEGQFFLVKGGNLYQYMPADRTVIVNDLDQAKTTKVPKSLRSLNLAPSKLTQLLRSEDLKVELREVPDSPLLSDLEQLNLYADKNPEGSSESQEEKIIPEDLPQLKPLLEGGVYVLEITPKKENMGFKKQLLTLEGETLLPDMMITYPDGESEIRYLTAVEEIEKNVDLDRKKVTKLPPESEAIYIRP